jgi:integration host factor subunit beta
LSFVKSDLIKELSDNYPNFLKKDLIKLFEIMVYEMQESLKRGERVELRDVFTIEPRIQKARISRNPKTGEKVNTPEKKTIHFKMAKELFKKINNNEE